MLSTSKPGLLGTQEGGVLYNLYLTIDFIYYE